MLQQAWKHEQSTLDVADKAVARALSHAYETPADKASRHAQRKAAKLSAEIAMENYEGWLLVRPRTAKKGHKTWVVRYVRLQKHVPRDGEQAPDQPVNTFCRVLAGCAAPGPLDRSPEIAHFHAP